MANQLCRSAETNHHIAQSITVSHRNTSTVSVYQAAATERLVTAVCLVCAVGRGSLRWPGLLCNLDGDKQEIGEVLSNPPWPWRWSQLSRDGSVMMIYGWQGKHNKQVYQRRAHTSIATCVQAHGEQGDEDVVENFKNMRLFVPRPTSSLLFVDTKCSVQTIFLFNFLRSRTNKV